MVNKSHTAVQSRSTLRRLTGGIAAVALAAGAAQASLAPPPRSQYTLRGVVRDFQVTHPDFGITNPGVAGHTVRTVSQSLGANGLPKFTGPGRQITSPWFDKNGNPIMPYGDAGLFGGHFDVDVYDAPTTKEYYHEHQYDDKFNLTYIDIANNPGLFFQNIVGSGYPNPLRIEFFNPQNGGAGTYIFDGGSGVESGITSNGFSRIVMASQLAQLKVTFESLDAMSGTKPGISQGDVAARAGAFTVKMFDTTNNQQVYEITAYEHVKFDKNGNKKTPPLASPPPMPGNDACGSPLGDTPGTFGPPSGEAITSGASFDQWFTTIPGVNTASTYDVTLMRDAGGVYTYTSPQFYPVDNTGYGNEGFTHNSNFTYSIIAGYTYKACAGQFFEFETSDDMWVFINGKLVADIGGIASSTKQRIELDRLALTDGQPFMFNLFYANRRDTANSLFTMRTNLELPSKVFTAPTSPLFD